MNFFSYKSAFRKLTLVTFILAQSFGSALPSLAAPIDRISVIMDSFLLDDPYTVVGGQPTGAGRLGNGRVGNYPEGACLPVLVQVENRDPVSGDTSVTVAFDHYNNDVGITHFNPLTSALTDPANDADNLNDFIFGTGSFNAVATFMTLVGSVVSTTINGPFTGDTGTDPVTDTDTKRHYNIDLFGIAAGETVQVMFCAQLDRDASEYGAGASMSIWTGTGGRENIAVRAQDLLVLPSLTLLKIVDGGSATSSDWSFTVSPAIDGQTNFSIPAGESQVVIENVAPDGTYSVTENPGPIDYTLTSVMGTNCILSGASASATVMAGDPPTNAVCEFTNTYAAPAFVATTGTLTVIKSVVNDDAGTSVAADFLLNVTGTNPSLTSFSGDASGTLITLEAGAYEVTEPSVGGYLASFGADCLGTLIAGEARTCTVTNDDVAVLPFTATTGTLTVIKTVVNDDGGTSLAADFTLNVTGTSPMLTSFSGDASGTLITLEAGAYEVTEPLAGGYLAAFSADCLGTMVAGEARICTVTNDDPEIPFVATTGTLTVIKSVINDNSGTSVATDFLLNVTGTNPSLTSFAGDASGTLVVLDAGAYEVTEPSSGEYLASFSADCLGTMVAGEARTCTVTNDDPIPLPIFISTTGTLTIIKNVINDNGGLLNAGDFNLSLESTTAGIVTFAGSASGTSFVINAGLYSVTEPDPLGYSLTASVGCSGTLVAGENLTCTLTNDDPDVSVPPAFVATTGTLTVIKSVVNDDAGTSVAADFTLNVTGTSPTLTSFSGDASGTLITLEAGAYEVTEPSAGGYLASFSAGCLGTMVAGEARTCTVTNDDVAVLPFTATTGTLTVIKTVVNDDGGTSEAGDFTLNVSGTDPSLTSLLGNASGTSVILGAGSYAITEPLTDGYAASFSADCVGTMVAGASRTCTVTNDDPDPVVLPFVATTGTLRVVKVVINDQGGAALPGDFTLNLSGVNPSLTSFPGSSVGVLISLDPGVYAVSEPYALGYSSVLSADCVGTIAAGETRTCTVTSDDPGATSGGGGGSSGSGGSGGGGGSVPVSPSVSVPTPAVLGIVTTDAVGGGSGSEDAADSTEPTARILGISFPVELPRTGLPAGLVFFFLAPLFWAASKRRE